MKSCLFLICISLEVFAQTSRWMQNLPDFVKNKPFSQIKLVGSHDSGAYKLSLSSTPSMEQTPLMDWVTQLSQESTDIEGIAEKVSFSQRLNIYAQLLQGVRALDLRMLYSPQSPNFYLSHSFATIPLNDALSQISQFMSENKEEVLVVQMQDDAEHSIQTTPWNDQIIAKVRSALGNLLIPVNSNNLLNVSMTLKSLVTANHRILLSFIDTFKGNYTNIWNSSVVSVYWPDAQNIEESISTIESYLPDLKIPQEQILNLVFFTVTPTMDSMAEAILGTLFGCPLPDSLFAWAEKMNATTIDFIRTNMTQLSGLNIISADIPTDELIQTVIDWNKAS